MTSTIGVKKIQYPNGTDILTLDSSGSVTLGGAATVTGATTTTGDITTSNSSGHRSLTVKGNTTTNYQGGSLLLANEGMDTNYGGTYLYHHKAGGSGTDDAAFNISQRTAAGGYVSNIWNVDYKNNAHAFYVPNGGASGAVAMGISSAGHVTNSLNPAFAAYRDAGDVTSNTTFIFNQVVYNIGSHYNASNGRFTAPIAGRYHFNVFLSHNGTGTGNLGFTRPTINGSSLNYLFPIYPGIDHLSLPFSFTLNLSANDYVTITTGTSAQILGSGNIHNHFSGHFVG